MDLETLQYDILYGKQYVYDGENPFERTEMHLGVKDAVLEKIEKISDGRYYITGENFTQSAYVEVNGELLETTYISPTTLLLNDVELKDGDEVDVAIRSNSSTRKVLTRTDSIIYKVPVEPLTPEVPPLDDENKEGGADTIDPNAANKEGGAAGNPIGEENNTGTAAGEGPIEVPDVENPVQN